ncbi:MAG: hypothetical protein EXS05_16935 [Planctomycetaceae bacterium]|nr:hypothetical protein [Planctomycetaceae bacterium]
MSHWQLQESGNERRPCRWLLRVTAVAWVAALVTLAWSWWLAWSQTQHPHFLPVLVPLLVQLVATVAVVGRGARQLLQGPQRQFAAAALIWVMTPACLGMTYFGTVWWISLQRYLPLNGWFLTVGGTGVALADLEVGLRYRQRTEGQRIVMFHQGAPDAAQQVAAMDEHLARIESLLGRESVARAHWVRGSIWGRENYQHQGLAMSMPVSAKPAGEVLAHVDRHELAHFAINQFATGRTQPPFVLIEGWAEAQSGQTSEELAANFSRSSRPFTLRELVGDEWYSVDLGPVYAQGGILVDYLLRRFGGPKLLQLYMDCRPATIARDVQRIYGLSLDDLDRDYRAEVERLTPPQPVRESRLLAKLSLDPAVSREDWDAFVELWSGRLVRASQPERDGQIVIDLTSNDTRGGQTTRTTRHVEIVRSGERRLVNDRGGGHETVMLVAPGSTFAGSRKTGESRWQASWSHPFQPQSLHERDIEADAESRAPVKWDPAAELCRAVETAIRQNDDVRATRLVRTADSIEVGMEIRLRASGVLYALNFEFAADDCRLLKKESRIENPTAADSSQQTWEYELDESAPPRLVRERNESTRSMKPGEAAQGRAPASDDPHMLIETAIRYEPPGGVSDADFQLASYPHDPPPSRWSRYPVPLRAAWMVSGLAVVGCIGTACLVASRRQ